MNRAAIAIFILVATNVWAAPPSPTLTADKIIEVELSAEPIHAGQEAALHQLLKMTPDSEVEEKADIYFRLAEHHAKQQRLQRLAKHDDLARKHMAKAVTMYRALTEHAAFASFTRMDMALFFYGYTLQRGGYLAEARAVYDKLLKNYPASRYVAEAHLVFADHYFEVGQLGDAESRYKLVLKFPKSSVYWYAMYKLGWVQLNRAQFQDALEAFFKITQATKRDRKQELLYRSARKDFVRAYAEIGKTDKALAAFEHVDKSAAFGMMQTLADLYLEQGKSAKAIYVLRELMRLAPKSQDACLWQHQIANATLTLPGATNTDKVREIDGLAKLSRVITTAECRDHAVAMVSDHARTYHSEWSKTKSFDSFAAAQRLYGTYLATFAASAELPRMRYFHAELLWSRAEHERDARLRTEYWETAALAFTDVVKAGKLDAKMLKEAAYAAVRAWLYAHETDPRAPAPTTTVSDTVPVPQPLPAREQNLLVAVDLYLKLVTDPKDDELVRIKLLKGNVLRRFAHLEAAVPIFRDILAKHGAHEVAEDTALLLLDTLVLLRRDRELVELADQLLANTKLMADNTTLRDAVDKIKNTALRLEVEQIEKRARKTNDFAELVRCGNAYLAIYNRNPTAPDNDQILYNAGVCFEDGRSIGAAIRMYQLLERYYPTSKITARAIARLGKAYGDIAFYEQAAQRLEQYAKKYAGEDDAHKAMHEAVFFFKGIGNDSKAVEDTKYFVRTFGIKRPADAADAAFSLTAIYEKQGDDDQVIRHLREYIRVHGAKGGVAKLVIAHGKIGQLLLRQSCPVKEVDGSCVKITRERAVATRLTRRTKQTQCGPESKIKLAVVPRDTRKVREALAAYVAASRELAKLPANAEDAGLARHYHAQGKLAEATVELERYFALAFPTNLDFDPRKPAVSKQSLARFDAWFAQKEQAGKRVAEQLAGVLAIKDSASSIAAAARLGQISQHFADALFTAEIPKDVRTGEFADDKIEAYCDVLTTRGDPLTDHALAMYGACLAKSTELGWFSEWSRLCERELGQIRPEAFPTASERRGDPDRVAVLTAAEPPAKLD